VFAGPGSGLHGHAGGEPAAAGYHQRSPPGSRYGTGTPVPVRFWLPIPNTHKVAELMVVRQSIGTIPERKIHGLRNISLFHPSVFGHGSWVGSSMCTFKDDGKSTVGGMAIGRGSSPRHGLDVGVGCESVGIFFQVIIFKNNLVIVYLRYATT
jgi:hypothetical protein